MQTAQPAIWTALQSDCCNGATLVSCDGNGNNQRVTWIGWYNMKLNGTINGTAIPSSVTYLDLGANAITGSIPSALPSGLSELFLYGNQMSSDLPSTLQRLALGFPGDPGNHFTGTLRLNRPIQLYINDNWITDVVIQDSSVLGTGGWLCDLSNNPLLGNPNIAGLTICSKNGLYSAGLLPVTRSTTLAKTTNVFGTTTLLGSLEMTANFNTMTNGATMTDGAITTVWTTNFERTIAQQTLSITMSVTGTQAFTLTSSLGTVAFVQILSDFVVNLGMMVRVLISGMLLTYVLTRTPFKREIKKMMSNGKTKTTSALEF